MKAVVILEVMWDWRNVTSSAGYREKAPPWFKINPDNFSGRRLHKWLVHYDSFLVTNACPELVSSAKGRGKPDHAWLSTNLHDLYPFDLLLVCGQVAQDTFHKCSFAQNNCRIIYLPHPAARQWTRQGLDLVQSVIKDGEANTKVRLEKGLFYNGPLQ